MLLLRYRLKGTSPSLVPFLRLYYYPFLRYYLLLRRASAPPCLIGAVLMDIAKIDYLGELK